MKTIALCCLLACVACFVIACERKAQPPVPTPAPPVIEAAPAPVTPAPAEPAPTEKAAAQQADAPEATEASQVEALEARVKELEQALKEAGQNYRNWRQVNERHERMPSRRLPFVPPPQPEPPKPETAAPADKLPTLLCLMFAKDAAAYEPVAFTARGEAGPQPEGQVLIKESYIARADDATRPDYPGYLYVMLKVKETAPDNDNGWVYGVLSEDGKRVLASGKLEVCVTCHVKAGESRLFGVPFDTPPSRDVAMR